MVSVLGVFGACDFAAWKRVAALSFNVGICIDGSLTITLLITLPGADPAAGKGGAQIVDQ